MVIPGLINQQEINSDRIIDIICKYYDTNIEQLKKRNRKREIVTVRRMCIYFLKKNTHSTLKSIGDIFGQDHTTVIHSLDTIQDFIDIKDAATIRDIRIINSTLNL